MNAMADPSLYSHPLVVMVLSIGSPEKAIDFTMRQKARNKQKSVLETAGKGVRA
jgi:hypothetical protein